MTAEDRTTPRGTVSRYGAFQLGAMELALPITDLREVVPCGTLARLPTRNPAVIGGLNLRDIVIPVLDLRRLLGHDIPELASPCVVVARHGGHVIGLLCDGVTGIFEAEPARAAAIQMQGETAGLISHTLVRPDTGATVSLLAIQALATLPDVPLIEDPERRPDRADDADDPQDRLALVLLRCGRVFLAVDAMIVHATLPAVDIEPSALARGYCRGVLRHAGSRMPAIDLMALLNLGELTHNGPLQAFVVRSDSGDIALLISEVCDVVSVSSASVSRVPTFALPHPTLLQGTVPASALPSRAAWLQDGGAAHYLLLDAQALLRDEDLGHLASTTQRDTEAGGTVDVQGFRQIGQQQLGRRSMLTYALGKETATPLEQIAEILPYSPELAVFDTRDSLLGILISRGRSVPVMCLSRLSGSPPPEIGPAVSILLVQVDDDLVGFAVPRLRSIESTDWEPRLADHSGREPGSLAALVRPGQLARVGRGTDERLLPVLDLQAIARSLQSRVGVSLLP